MASVTNGLTSSVSYSNEKPSGVGNSGPTTESSDIVGGDSASSGFLFTNYKKHDDLKAMLDNNKDSSKLEAMKRIIGMIAKGKDASELFPAVVKNVVCKNIEVKKLVYVYLVRYAEEQQDLALLSISTFQRALKDPNQLIRASALRVLSSIRVPMIVPIMMLAIKEAVTDMSPYVRKTAAHAIPKLYSLDPEQKDILIEVIDKLLADKATLVMGSAIQAFEEVCPERIDLIHKNYRKLCNLMVDMEEWGQVVLINMLTRYCRMQFVDPNKGVVLLDQERPFYDSDEDKNKDKEEEGKADTYVMDADHRLLLKTCQPLLNSRNASVVMAVAQLYHHCAPVSEVGTVSKALIRLLREHKEVQYIVLSNIASMTITRKSMFEPFLKSFYIRISDPTHVKLLKLEILTNLATEASISTILREFQTYVTSSDPEFAAATIQAIGRCASNIPEITEACMNGLVSLLSNRNEAVVGESVVVIKKLLQMQSSEHKSIISHLAKLVDTMTVPMARASILWLIGEYSDRIPKIAPDVLRKVVKNFVEEDDIVKLQIINLAAKLCITNAKQTKLLCQYVLNLAKYDQNYDIRDRARFIRQLVLPSGESTSSLAKHAKKIFLAPKPAPLLESKFKDRNQYQLSTLSHLINAKATEYQELPDWPEVAPDPSVRNVEVIVPSVSKKSTKKETSKIKSFYSESESGSEETSSGSESSTDGSEDEDKSESGSTSGPDEVVEADEDDDKLSIDSPKISLGEKKKSEKERKKSELEENHDESSEESSSEESSSEESSDESESDSEKEAKQPFGKQAVPMKKAEPAKSVPAKTDLLLDLDDFAPSSGANNIFSPDSSLMLIPSMSSGDGGKIKSSANYSDIHVAPVQVSLRSFELFNRVAGAGLAATYKFTRTVSVFSPTMISVEMVFVNSSDAPIANIRIENAKSSGIKLQEFSEIPLLAQGCNISVLLGIDFNDTTQPAQFDICTKEKRIKGSIAAPIGELIQPYTRTENEFRSLQAKLSGMNENSHTISLTEGNNIEQVIMRKVMETANVLPVGCTQSNLYFFAGKTVSTGVDVLVSVKVNEGREKATVSVNCEKIVIGSMLAKELKTALTS